MYPYLSFLALFFGLPSLAMMWILRRPASRYRRTAYWLLVFVFSIGLFWDWLSVRTGVWRYDVAPSLGLWAAGLPVEELVGFYGLSVAFMFAVCLAALGRRGHV